MIKRFCGLKSFKSINIYVHTCSNAKHCLKYKLFPKLSGFCPPPPPQKVAKPMGCRGRKTKNVNLREKNMNVREHTYLEQCFAPPIIFSMFVYVNFGLQTACPIIFAWR